MWIVATAHLVSILVLTVLHCQDINITCISDLTDLQAPILAALENTHQGGSIRNIVSIKQGQVTQANAMLPYPERRVLHNVPHIKLVNCDIKVKNTGHACL